MSRRQQSVLTVVLILLMLGPAPVRAAEATMTFTGALDVVGLLSSISVAPNSVTVPAGGEVSFVNATSTTLKVKVGGKSTRVKPGGSASMLFTGADRTETFSATATALDLPVVGALTSSAGQVTVGAIPAAVAPEPAWPRSSAGPRSSREPDGRGAPESDHGGSDHGGKADSADGTVVPLPPSGSPRPDGSASSSASAPASASASPGATGDTGASVDPAGPGGSDGSGDSDRSDDGGRPVPDTKRADTEVEPVLPPFPGFSSTHDQLGLVFLLGSVVLAGLGAALFRTVLAFRPAVAVGAHSQAASKARKVRRRRRT